MDIPAGSVENVFIPFAVNIPDGTAPGPITVQVAWPPATAEEPADDDWGPGVVVLDPTGKAGWFRRLYEGDKPRSARTVWVRITVAGGELPLRRAGELWLT